MIQNPEISCRNLKDNETISCHSAKEVVTKLPKFNLFCFWNLKIHLKYKPLDKLINIDSIVEMTGGYSGAQIENLLNEQSLESTVDLYENLANLGLGSQLLGFFQKIWFPFTLFFFFILVCIVYYQVSPCRSLFIR